MMALIEYGVGMRMNPGSLHALAFFPTMTSPISCLVSFAIPFGGTVALTLMSTLFNNKSGPQHADAQTGIMYGFAALIPFMWLSVVLTTFLGNVWILKEGGHDVINGAYLWSLITGKKLVRENKIRRDNGGSGAGGNNPEKTVNSHT
jgi:hypothetical protein